MEHNKLVRDKIPEIIHESGDVAITHVAGEEEYKEMLIKKLQEEVEEFTEDHSLEEAADVLEVLRSICSNEGLDITKLEEVRKKKANKRGGFDKKIILEKTKSNK